MRCSDLQSNLSLYADGIVSEGESLSIKGHLETCPLCRQKLSEYQEIRARLRQIQRPVMPVALSSTIKQAVRTHARAGKRSWLPLSADLREWLQLSVMPYGVGVFASVLIGMTFLTMMFTGLFSTSPFAGSMAIGERSTMRAANANPLRGGDQAEISPSDFAHTRLGLASESPSVNPQGALIALTKSFVRGEMKDDEVVVVADVFGNGLAQIAEVVEPSRDRHAVGELQKALASDPAFTPFVPSTMEDRPESVRVILKFQSVNVSTRSPKIKRRL